MLSAVLTRGFKCYKDITFIPCSNGEMFSLFVGDNGVGKSAIMEGLDFFFNSAPWNMNQDVTGSQKESAFFCAFFEITELLQEKIGITQDELENIRNIFTKIKTIDTSTFGTSSKDPRIAYKEVFDCYRQTEDRLFIPIQKDFNGNTYGLQTLGGILGADDVSLDLIQRIITAYKYIYIPVELRIEDFLRIESSAFQSFRNDELSMKITELLTARDPDNSSILDQINTELTKYLNEIEGNIQRYSSGYSISSEKRRKDNVYAKHITTDIIDGFFGKKFFRKDNKIVDDLSSGERRMMLIDIIGALLSQHKSLLDDQDKILILSIDEPEASLHVSRMFTQFKKIFDFSKQGVQVFAISHWYGAIPIISSGTLIHLNDDVIIIKIYNLRDFFVDNSKEKPALRTKSFFDFASSIFLSLRDMNSKYLIVEGTEDVNYLEKYFPDIQIIPTGGITKSIKIYDLIHSMYDEKEDNDLKGKLFFLIDTDSNRNVLEGIPDKIKKDFEKIVVLKRLQIDESQKKICLHKAQDKNVTSPPTAIEDVLDPSILYKSVELFLTNENDVLLENFKFNEKCFHSGIGKMYGPAIHIGNNDNRQQDEENLRNILGDINNRTLTNKRKASISKIYSDNLGDSPIIIPWMQEIIDHLG